jgi:hypothetical protein
MKNEMIAAIAGLAVSGIASAAFVNYSVVSTTGLSSGGNAVTRWEVFANFNGPTDTVLNVFNFQAQGGWAAHADAQQGFWHKDLSDSNSGVMMQEFGTWAPTLTGSAAANRPFDSFLLIGGTTGASNSTTADPSWAAGSFNQPQLPAFNDLGWFNSSPPNLQGRVGTAPNTATQVKLGQFMLSANDTAFRTYTLRIAVNNATVSTPVFSDGSFNLPAPGAIALLGLAGLTGRRRR